MDNVENNVTTTESYSLERNDFFIQKVSRKFIVSSVISMVFLYAASLVDTLLVGIFLGEDGLAAMSLVSPVFLIYYTVGATIGIGANIVASRILGQGEMDKYRKVFSCTFILLAAFTVIMTVLSYAFIDKFVLLLSGKAADSSFELVKQYLLYYIPGGGLTLLAYVPLYFLKTEGKPQLSSRLFTLSAIINVILSALFLSPICNMGIGGASFATSISYFVIDVIGFYCLLHGSDELRFVKKSVDKPLVREIVVAGIPNGLNNLLESAQILLINMLLIEIGAASLLPCYTIVRNIMGVQHSVIVGISSALIPLIGVFYGEHDHENERAVMTRSTKTGVLIMAALIAVCCVLGKSLFMLFGVTSPVIISEGIWALPLASVGLILGYVNALYTSYLTAINREGFATWIVALRTFVLLAVFAVPLAFTVGSLGIWLSFTIAELATWLAYIIIRNVIRRKNSELDKFLLDTSIERDGDITFSVRNEVEDIVAASESCSNYCEEHEVDMRRCMRVSLAIEELLTFLIGNCFGAEQSKYIDVRVCKLNEEVMVRFRYVGKVFDPLTFYNDNSDNDDMSEELLGLKMIFKSASIVYFRQTLGTNNLMLMF